MTLIRCCVPVVVFGCISTKSPSLEPNIDVPLVVEDPLVVEEPSLQMRLAEEQSWVSFVNEPLPEGAKSPSAGAQYVYARGGSSNARVSPVDIHIRVEDASGNAIHESALDHVSALYHQIYGWQPDAWRSAMVGRMGATETVQTKSNFFWETLAQHMAERIFEDSITPPLLVYGPHCLDSQGDQHCSSEGIDEAHRVLVRTRIDGARDPLNPATRTIVYVAERDRLKSPEIILDIEIPAGLNVGGPESEYLDFRPAIGGQRESLDRIRVLAHIPSGVTERTRNTDYPDYSLLYVPLRHLVFQGEVDNPKGSGATLSYVDTESLRQRFDEVIADLRTAETAQRLVEELRPFLNTDYYYMFDQGEGVDGYRDYLLGPDGIGGGISPDVGRVELILE